MVKSHTIFIVASDYAIVCRHLQPPVLRTQTAASINNAKPNTSHRQDNMRGYCAFTPKAHKEENDPGSHSLCIGSQADKEGKDE